MKYITASKKNIKWIALYDNCLGLSAFVLLVSYTSNFSPFNLYFRILSRVIIQFTSQLHLTLFENRKNHTEQTSPLKLKSTA